MLILTTKIREKLGIKNKKTKQTEVISAILYGPKIERALPLEINLKEFEKTYQEAGESSLITLTIGTNEKEKFLVLINEVKREPLSGRIILVDFYQPRLDEETEAEIPLFFEGEAPACKELGGT